MINRILCRLFDSLGKNFFCPVCRKKVRKFNPLPSFYKDLSIKYGYLYSFDDFETLNHRAYSCPFCNASDRDRLFALYVSKQLTEYSGSKLAMLEIAPSKPLSEMLRRSGEIVLRTADLMMDDVDERVDITDMRCYGDGVFDAFICSHVLEHVRDDEQAMQELFRILKQGGWGILMVPIILTIDHIDEDPELDDIGERWRRFGQGDHVRNYSKNGFIKRIEKSGFVVRQYDREYFGCDQFTKNGIADKSVLYVVEKI